MSVHLLPTTAPVFDYGLCPRELCSFTRRPLASSRSMDETWRPWLWKCQRWGRWAEPSRVSPTGWAMETAALNPWCLLGARHSVFVVYSPCPHLSELSPLACFDGCVGGFPSSPPAATADTAKIRWSLESVSESRVTHQTRCCLGMVLEKKGNFSLFFSFAKLGMWVVSCFSCIVFLLGKGSRSSPPHPPGNEEEGGLWSEEQTLAIALTSLLPHITQ